MGILRFKAEEVKKLTDHALSCKKFNKETDWDKEPDDDGSWPTKNIDEAKLVLVHDSGVYLMSNGCPILPGEKTKNFVVYAIGMDPDKDEDYYDAARDAVGGDDFGEHLPHQWLMLAHKNVGMGCDVKIKFSEKSMAMSFYAASNNGAGGHNADL